MDELPKEESAWKHKRIREDLGTEEEHEDDFYVYGDFGIERDDDDTYEAYVIADGSPIKVKGEMYSFEEAVAFLNGVREAKEVVGHRHTQDEDCPKHPEGDIVKSLRPMKEMLGEEYGYQPQDYEGLVKAQPNEGEEADKATQEKIKEAKKKTWGVVQDLADKSGVGKQVRALNKQVELRDGELGLEDMKKLGLAIGHRDPAKAGTEVARIGPKIVEREGEKFTADKPKTQTNHVPGVSDEQIQAEQDHLQDMRERKEIQRMHKEGDDALTGFGGIPKENYYGIIAPIMKNPKDVDHNRKRIKLDNDNSIVLAGNFGVNKDVGGKGGRKRVTSAEAMESFRGRDPALIAAHAPSTEDGTNYFDQTGATSRLGRDDQPTYRGAADDYGKKFLQIGGLMDRYLDQIEAMYPSLYKFQNRKDAPALDQSQVPIMGPVNRWGAWNPLEGGAPNPVSMLYYGNKDGVPVINKDVFTVARAPGDIVHAAASGGDTGSWNLQDMSDEDVQHVLQDLYNEYGDDVLLDAGAGGVARGDATAAADKNDLITQNNETARAMGTIADETGKNQIVTSDAGNRTRNLVFPSIYGSNKKGQRVRRDKSGSIFGDVTDPAEMRSMLGEYINNALNRVNYLSQGENEFDDEFSARKNRIAQEEFDDLVGLNNRFVTPNEWQRILFDEKGQPRADTPEQLRRMLYFMDNPDKVKDVLAVMNADNVIPGIGGEPEKEEPVDKDLSGIGGAGRVVTELDPKTQVKGENRSLIDRYANFGNATVPWTNPKAPGNLLKLFNNVLANHWLSRDGVAKVLGDPSVLADLNDYAARAYARNPKTAEYLKRAMTGLGREVLDPKTRAGSEGESKQGSTYQFDELPEEYANLVGNIMLGNEIPGWKGLDVGGIVPIGRDGQPILPPVDNTKKSTARRSVEALHDMSFSDLLKARKAEMDDYVEVPPSPSDPNPMKANYRVVYMGEDKDSVWPMEVRDAETGKVAFEGNDDPTMS